MSQPTHSPSPDDLAKFPIVSLDHRIRTAIGPRWSCDKGRILDSESLRCHCTRSRISLPATTFPFLSMVFLLPFFSVGRHAPCLRLVGSLDMLSNRTSVSRGGGATGGMCPRVIVMWSRSYVGHPFMLTADCCTVPVTHHITISTLIGPPGISPATRSSHHPMRHAGVTGLHNVPPSSTWQTAYQIYPRSSNETPLHPFLCFAKMHDGTITRENDRGKISIHLFDSATFFPPLSPRTPPILCT